MSTETALYLGSDDGIYIEHPRDISDPSAVVDLDGLASTSVVVRIFDVESQPTLVQNGNSSADTDTFTLAGDPALFAAGQTVASRDDSNDAFYGVVNSVDTAAMTITLDTSLAGGAYIPNQRRWWVQLGDTLLSSEYGTALPGVDTWGYQITVPDDHPGLYHGQHVVCELEFDGGTGLRKVRYLERIVRRGDS